MVTAHQGRGSEVQHDDKEEDPSASSPPPSTASSRQLLQVMEELRVLGAAVEQLSSRVDDFESMASDAASERNTLSSQV